MMQPLYSLALIFLCSLFFLSPVLSIECDNETKYPWPHDNPQFCCDKCPPGKYMSRRHQSICQTECKPCTGKRYRDTYNKELDCNFCDDCEQPNMEYVSNCTATQNVVCRCRAGYKCKDPSCKECVLMPTTPQPTPPSPTTDPVPGFLVIIALLSLGIALVLATNIKPILCWIRSKHGYILAKTPAPVPPCSLDDDVSKPVQEVCGKCDQPLDV